MHHTKIAAVLDTDQVSELGEWLRVDPQASRAPFDQLRSQIIECVRDGRLAPGTRLPPVREMAELVGLAVNTVARAYRELEAAGIVETRGRQGTFVARVDPADQAMAAAAQVYVQAVRALGLDQLAAARYLDAAFAADQPNSSRV